MEGDLDRAAVALLRKLKPEIQQEFLESEEFRSLSAADRERVYVIDAELSALRSRSWLQPQRSSV